MATTLFAGDIAVVGYNTGQIDDATVPIPTYDSLQFATLVALDAGAVIYFTDRAWNGATFTADGGDGVVTYTVGGGGLAAGSVIDLALGGLNPEEAGDTIYVYQGATADSPTSFLFAIEIGDGDTTFSGSLANTGLQNGVSAVAVGLDSATYSGPTTEAAAYSFNGESLIHNIADSTNWVGDNRFDGPPSQSAFDQPDLSGPLGRAADFSLWAGAGGGGGAIVGVDGDATVGGGATGFNIQQLYNLANGGSQIFYLIQDVVFDTVHGKFFVADSDIASGHNRVLQGDIADLIGNPGEAPALLYSDTGTTTASRIFNIQVDPDNGIVYFDHGQTLAKVNYDTAGQTPVTLAVLGGTGSGNPYGTANSGFIDDFVINFETGTIYASVHRVLAAADGDAVSRNYIAQIVGLDSSDGANAFSWGGGQITSLPFSPQDDEAGVLFNSGESFPQELGTIEGVALSPDGATLYFVVAETLYDDDGDGGVAGDGDPLTTDPVHTPGGIYSYALTGNAAGVYTALYTPTDDGDDGSQAIDLANGPQGILDDIEVDPVTGDLFFTDQTGDQVFVSSNPPGDEGIWRIDSNGDNLSFFQVVSNTLGLVPSSLFLNHAPIVVSSTQAAPEVTEVAGLGSGLTAAVQPFTALDLTDPETASQIDQLAGAVVRVSNVFEGDRLSINDSVSGTLEFGAQDITYSYDSATGVMTLSGESTFSNYETAITLVRYQSSGDNPTDYGANTARTIVWSVSDGLDFSDEVATTITVIASNDDPVNLLPGVPASGQEDASFAVTGLQVSDVDADPAGQDITVTLSVANGELTLATDVVGGVTAGDVTGNSSDTVTITATQNEINATLGGASTLQYLGANDFNGLDHLTILTSDLGHTGGPGALSDTDILDISVTAVPDIVDDALTTDEDTAITANVITGSNGASADSFEGTPVLTDVTQGANGSVTFTADRAVTYTPDADYNGSDSFTYTVTSGGVTETATVDVTVSPVSDVANDSLTTDEDIAITANVITGSNDASADNFEGSPVLIGVTQGVNGSVTFAADGSVTYTPNANTNGPDSFTYSVASRRDRGRDGGCRGLAGRRSPR